MKHETAAPGDAMSFGYKSEAALYYNELAKNTTRWKNPDAAKCGSGGSGWWLAEVDTWPGCSLHPSSCDPEGCDGCEECEA